jgi:nitrous oxidase accessory protein
MALLAVALTRTGVVAQPVAAVVPGDMRSLAAAVRNAPDGSTVRVPPGIYSGATIEIDRPLRLMGEPGAILDGRGDTPLLVVRGGGVHVGGLTFRNVAQSHVEDRSALRLVDAQDCVVAGNTFENTYFAIYVENTERCSIEGNRIVGEAPRETAAGNGIHLWHSRHIVIARNVIRGHRDGIYFEFVEDSRVDDNESHGNLRYGLHFMFSDRCSYTGNTFVGNGAGVAVMYTRQVQMQGNTFARNRGTSTYGLLLKDISDAVLTDNDFLDNTVALFMEGTTRVVVGDSRFRGNGWAIRIRTNVVDHRFEGNTFIGNTFDLATNGRRVDAIVVDNYWDAYSGYDLDGDGVGDVPFRPVRLLSYLVERHPPMLALLRGLFVQLLDAAERVLPVFTPDALIDERPRMHPGVRIVDATRIMTGRIP